MVIIAKGPYKSSSKQKKPAQGYRPPNLYGSSPINVNSTYSSKSSRAQEIEEELYSCHIQCYQYWQWLLLTSAIFGSVQTISELVNGDTSSSKSSESKADKFQQLGLLIWFGVQSALALLAIHQRSLTKATITWWMMVVCMIPLFVLEVRLILAVVKIGIPDDSILNFLYLFVYIALFLATVNLFVHVFASMTGAWKVRKILIELNMTQGMKSFRAEDRL